ncbi:MAG: PAS domain-containing protein, partial [Sphingomonadales bacterium]|nr:PAS domain-containing protein [Sphingomonadales bacterium]
MQQTAQAAQVSPKTAAPDNLKTERDRFVALAFCWADFLLEVDLDETIVFAGGPWQGLTGITTNDLKGRRLSDIVHADDIDLMRSLLNVARRQGRIEDVDIRFQGERSSALPISFAGYFLEDLGSHFFLAMRVSRNPGAGLVTGGHVREGDSSLYDAGSFADVLGGKLKSAKGSELQDNQ